MKDIKVRGYTYKRNGKTIVVRSYVRSNNSNVTSYGKEYLDRLERNDGFTEFADWKSLQDEVNEVGWENSSLFKFRGSKRTEDGRKIYNIPDPRGNDPENHYVGLRSNGKLVGISNVYVGDDYVEIGDFEVFKNHKGKGYGRRMFNGIRKKYPDKHYMLLYRDNKAKKFWEKMGFKRTGGRVMEADL